MIIGLIEQEHLTVNYCYIDTRLNLFFICFLFIGDIAFRFLKYIDNLKDKDDFGNITIPRNISIEGYQVPQDEADISSSSSSSDDEEASHMTHHVTVCDINQEMLDVGKQKAESYGIYSGLYFNRRQPLEKILFCSKSTKLLYGCKILWSYGMGEF